MVLLLMTPAYYRKVKDHEDGVWIEWQRLDERFGEIWRDPSGSDDGRQFYPILVAGEPQRAVPSVVSHLKYQDITQFVPKKRKQGGVSTTDTASLRLDPMIEEILAAAELSAVWREDCYPQKEELISDSLVVSEPQQTRETDAPILSPTDVLVTLLTKEHQADLSTFSNVKHSELDLVANRSNWDLLVSTAAFRRVLTQRNYLIVGRKGSGKSTLKSMLALREGGGAYRGCIALRAENLSLSTIYTLFGERVLSDAAQLTSRLVFFLLAWQGVLALCLIDLLGKRDQAGLLDPKQKAKMKPLRAFLKERGWWSRKAGSLTPAANAKDNDFVQRSAMQFAAEKLAGLLTDSVANSLDTKPVDELIAGAVNELIGQDFLSVLLGKQVHKALFAMADLCEGRVLVTLDEFDTLFGRFREEAEDQKEAERRAWVERDWLLALLMLAADIKQKQHTMPRCFRSLDFYLTIPRDRFADIEKHNRDAYLHALPATNLLWSGMELVEMIVKRLEKVRGTRAEGADTVMKLERLLQRDWPQVPQLLKFEFNGHIIEMPMFLYVLRHTFWRPRDILVYFVKILTAAQEVTGVREMLSVAEVRRIVSRTTRIILETDFFVEYKERFPALREIVLEFRGCTQVLTFREVEQILRSCNFGKIGTSRQDLSISDKISLLFDVGFLGVLLDDSAKANLHIACNHAFYFNEDYTALEGVLNGAYSSAKFVIHPIFTEMLNLSCLQAQYLLHFTWEYVREQSPSVNTSVW